jgi:glutaredoxin-related protein
LIRNSIILTFFFFSNTSISQAPVMLFMKGNPDQPRCGFSRQVFFAGHKKNLTHANVSILDCATLKGPED